MTDSTNGAGDGLQRADDSVAPGFDSEPTQKDMAEDAATSDERGWTIPGVDMSLDTALRRLRKGKEPFGAADRATIAAVVEALGSPPNWHVEARGQWVGAIFDDRIHIHPTMIVTSVQVPGAIRTDTYPHWPWRVELTGWTNRNEPRHERDRSGMKFCQVCMNPLDERHADGCY